MNVLINDKPTEKQAEFIAHFRRHVPRSPLTDQQVMCVLPLLAINGLHNIHPVCGVRRGVPTADGGYAPCGEGISVRLRNVDWATFDSSALTNLVLRAHEVCARVSLSPASGFGIMEVTIHPRDPEAHHLFDSHLSLTELVDKIERDRPLATRRLKDLRERIGSKVPVLEGMRDSTDRSKTEWSRLNGKIEGVNLALLFVDEILREAQS